MKINPLEEYAISEKLAYETSNPYWVCNSLAGRADGIEWCIKHLNDKAALQKEYESCLHVKENSARINVPEVMRYYEGRADGIRWCLENFSNLELPEECNGHGGRNEA